MEQHGHRFEAISGYHSNVGLILTDVLPLVWFTTLVMVNVFFLMIQDVYMVITVLFWFHLCGKAVS